MPCTDGGPDYRQNRIDLLTDYLCETLRAYERGAPYETLPMRILVWWEDHKQLDAARARDEDAKRKRDALRKQVLERLTPEELAALKGSLL